MLKKIQSKAIFLHALLSCGAGLSSKLVLLREFARLQYRRYRGPKDKEFSCAIRAHGRSACMHFTGSMSELHTLVDIFRDESYKPKHDHVERLFSGSVKTLLDLGANIGLASAWFALAYPGISIDAYEPNPRVFRLLEKNLSQFPNARAFEKALDAKEGTVAFNQSEHTLASSVFAAQKSSAIRVEATTLDSAIERMGGSVDLIKIDIEGSEFEVLKHSKKLEQVRAIIGEAHTGQSGHTQEELNQLLSIFTVLEIYNPLRNAVFGFYAARTKPIIDFARSSHE